MTNQKAQFVAYKAIFDNYKYNSDIVSNWLNVYRVFDRSWDQFCVPSKTDKESVVLSILNSFNKVKCVIDDLVVKSNRSLPEEYWMTDDFLDVMSAEICTKLLECYIELISKEITFGFYEIGLKKFIEISYQKDVLDDELVIEAVFCNLREGLFDFYNTTDVDYEFLQRVA